MMSEITEPVARAIRNFDNACQEYAFRGTHSPARVVEITDQYHEARLALTKAIAKMAAKSFVRGQEDERSRVEPRVRHDMGG